MLVHYISGTVTATVIFSVLKGTFATALRDIHISMIWEAESWLPPGRCFMLSGCSGLLWIVMTCCCSGNEPNTRGVGPSYAYVGVPPTDSTAHGPSFSPVSMTEQYPLHSMQQTPHGQPSNGYLYP
jgi:hypothetical protein